MIQVTPVVQDARPKRANQGQGGQIAQLQKVSNDIRPDLDSTKKAKAYTTDIPSEISENVMAPPVKRKKHSKQAMVCLLFIIYTKIDLCRLELRQTM